MPADAAPESAGAKGLNAAQHLDRHDSDPSSQALGDLVVPGPTFTNVNDFRAVPVV